MSYWGTNWKDKQFHMSSGQDDRSSAPPTEGPEWSQAACFVCCAYLGLSEQLVKCCP